MTDDLVSSTTVGYSIMALSQMSQSKCDRIYRMMKQQRGMTLTHQYTSTYKARLINLTRKMHWQRTSCVVWQPILNASKMPSWTWVSLQFPKISTTMDDPVFHRPTNAGVMNHLQIIFICQEYPPLLLYSLLHWLKLCSLLWHANLPMIK